MQLAHPQFRTIRVLIVAGLVISLPFAPATGQTTLGGCVDNDPSAYFAQVVRSASALEFRTSEVFVVLKPGDEVRVCRTKGPVAIITLQSRGIGFRVPANTLKRLESWTRRNIDVARRSCIARAIDIIQTRQGGDEQTRQLLALARRDSLSLFQLLNIRLDPLPRGPCDSMAATDSVLSTVPPIIEKRFGEFFESRIKKITSQTLDLSGPVATGYKLDVKGRSLLVTLSSPFFEGTAMNKLCDAVEQAANFVARTLRETPKRPLVGYSVRALYQNSQDIVLANTNADGSLTCKEAY